MNTAKAEKPKRQARQSSIYRKLEILLCEIMSMSTRIPKHAHGLHVVCERAVNDTLESLSVTEFAIRTEDMHERMQYISMLIHEMTMVKTCLKQLYAYSARDRTETKISACNEKLNKQQTVRKPEYGRVVSHAQYARYLVMTGEIAKEVARWRQATVVKMSQTGNK